MIPLHEARSIVEGLLAEMQPRAGADLMIDDRHTRKESWCWIFFYNTRAYVEKGDELEALAGNGPIVIDRNTGEVHTLDTARPIDEQLAQLRR